MEVPPAFRELADKGVAQARDTYEKAKAATEQATNQLKEAYTTAAKGATDYNIKVIEIARANTNTAVDNAFELLGAKSLTEFVELSTKHVQMPLARSSRCKPRRLSSSGTWILNRPKTKSLALLLQFPTRLSKVLGMQTD